MNEKYSNLGTKLRYLIELLDKDVEACYKDSNMGEYKPRYTSIFRILDQEQALTIGEISQITKMSQPRTSQTIKAMIQNKLIKQIKTKDARKSKVCLTQSAKDLIPQLKKQWTATTIAAKNLDNELPMPLSTIVQAAIDSLEKESFKDRIQKQYSTD